MRYRLLVKNQLNCSGAVVAVAPPVTTANDIRSTTELTARANPCPEPTQLGDVVADTRAVKNINPADVTALLLIVAEESPELTCPAPPTVGPKVIGVFSISFCLSLNAMR